MGLFDGLAGVGVSAATGNLLGAGIGLLGLGTSLFGMSEQSEAAQHAAQIQGQIAGLEGQVNDQRETAMQLSSRRQNLETMRTAQKQSAVAIANATNQGAQFGSGLQGGLGQIRSQSLFNMEGVNQNQEIGTNIFGLNRQISADKVQLSQVQSDQATAQGISSLGGGIMQSAAPISRLAQGFSLG